MFSKKNSTELSILFSSNKKLLKEKNKAKKNKDIAYNIGLYYLLKNQLDDAYVWFEMAYNHGHVLACESMAEIHINFVINQKKMNFLHKTTFSMEKAYDLLKNSKTQTASALRVQIYVYTNGIDSNIYSEAIDGLNVHTEICLPVILHGCIHQNKLCLNNMSLKEAFEYYCNRELKQSSYIIAQCISQGILPKIFLGKNVLFYLESAAKHNHPEAQYYWGRHLLNQGEVCKGESFIKSSFNQNFVLAGLFLADYKTINGEGQHPETLNLYLKCAQMGDIGAQCIVFTRHLSGIEMGITQKKCEEYYANGLKHNHPLALLWKKHNQL